MLLFSNDCVYKVAALRRQQVIGHDAAMEEVQLRNKFLSDKLERLEQAIASQQPAAFSQVTGVWREVGNCNVDNQKPGVKISKAIIINCSVCNKC